MEEQKKYERELQAVTVPQVGMFLNPERFEFAQRIGKMLAASTMLPDHFRNNIGNCLIALNMSERLGIDVFGLMQTSYVVHGRPGFEAKLLIAIFNARTQLFIPPLRWEMKGDFPKGPDAACRAYAVDKETNEPLYGEWIDWDLVTAEGWHEKKGSKWLTMPGQMYRYRAASFFINAYEPGLKMGIHTVDELEDMVIDVTPRKALIPDLPKEPAPGKDIYKVKDETEGDHGPEAPSNDDEKPLFDRLKMARTQFAQMVIDNIGEIEDMHPDEISYLQGKWKNKSGDPWPFEIKQEPPNQDEDKTLPQGEDEESPPPTNGNGGLYGGMTWGACNDFFYGELGRERFEEIISAHKITDFGNLNSGQRMQLFNAWNAALDVKISS